MNLIQLIEELTALPTETEWLEFKQNNSDPDQIGEYVSALANSAALFGRKQSYLVWGVDNGTHELIGTKFYPREARVGNEELENWLLRLLNPRIDLRFHEADTGNKHVVMLEVPAAPNQPVSFKKVKYIRVGSYTKRLHDYPEKERALWRLFDQSTFETGAAKDRVTADEVLESIHYTKCFSMLGQPLPDNREAILRRLISENVVEHNEDNSFNITKVGAILFAQNLTDFDILKRKALRVIIYKGNNRVKTTREITGIKGYAVGFEGAIRYINDQLPQNEEIDQALRKEVRMYPEIAIRELVANALIHQDFNITGSGPMVEIFDDRMEISNPGIPLIDPLRFIDEPPRSRNEMLASLMRRVNVCEERGSGIDKVVSSVELFQLPPPDFRVAGSSTVAVLFGQRKFSQMTREERIRGCYQHACLLHVSGKTMSNSSLRKRLGIKDKNYPMASRIIRDSVDAGLIKSRGGGKGSRKDASYVPFWA